MTESKIPVTIISGFLGAGKTTLLNNIIAQSKDTRFAIIENEFGEIGIDDELVIGAEEGIFEMSNGCICCSLNNDLAELLAKLIDRDDFEHLVIETTGIADPAAVATAFTSDYAVQQYFQLDGVICMVDAKHVEQTLIAEKEAAKQISFADAIIFNKKDTVSENELNKIKASVQKINPYAKVMDANHANVDTTALLQLNAFNFKIIQQTTFSIADQHDHHHHHITSQSYIFDTPFDLLKFRHFVQVLLLVQNQRIYRMKGILNIQGEDQRIIFQSVQQQTIFSKGTKWEEGEIRKSKLVVIGNNLNKQMFDKRLRQCLIK